LPVPRPHGKAVGEVFVEEEAVKAKVVEDEVAGEAGEGLKAAADVGSLTICLLLIKGLLIACCRAKTRWQAFYVPAASNLFTHKGAGIFV
jgi:hypothetical protein